MVLSNWDFLVADETRALALFSERAGLWSPGHLVGIADHASAVTGATGEAGVKRLLVMARWVEQKRD